MSFLLQLRLGDSMQGQVRGPGVIICYMSYMILYVLFFLLLFSALEISLLLQPLSSVRADESMNLVVLRACRRASKVAPMRLSAFDRWVSRNLRHGIVA